MNCEFEEYLKTKHAEIYCSGNPGYEFLKEGEEWICFSNPHSSEDLLVRTSPDSYLLFFDQWSQSFSNDAQGIQDLIQQMESIMDDRAYIWKAKIGSKDFISLVNDDPGVFYEMAKQGFQGRLNGALFSITPDEVEQSFVFWDPAMMEPEKTVFMN